jgi:DNA ligase-associated metallophosphoesterase
MNTVEFFISGNSFEATATSVLYWPVERLLVVSDLHLGKSERIARRSGQMLPPYETKDTLDRLDETIRHFNPRSVVCLGDSFDDLQAEQNLDPAMIEQINALMSGREWIWIEGNHDAGPIELGGQHLTVLRVGSVDFRHIAKLDCEKTEISGHYHPKARIAMRGRTISRPCFLYDQTRIIMPSFGTYTGGLYSTDPSLTKLMSHDARAILTGIVPHLIPMPR